MAKSKKKLRVAVLGAGAIAQRRHLPEYSYRKDVEVVALVDLNARRAEEVAARYGIPSTFTDYRDALALRPDLVSVCTPNRFHAEMSIAALKGGAHVLCEKPMALSLKEARGMLAAAKAAKKQLMIGHNQRFAAAHVRGKEILQSGLLGKCVAFRTTFAHNGPEGWSVDGKDCHFFKKNLTGLGSLADLGVHKIDLMRWLLEDDFVEATGMMATLAKPADVEDTAFAVLRTRSGILGEMFAGWDMNPGSDNSTVLFCQKGILRLEQDPVYTVKVEMRAGEQMHIQTKALQTNEAGGQYTSGVIDGFVDAVQNRKKVPIPADDVIRSLAAVLACVESAQKGRAVRVQQA